jgi:hypothetical protein
MTARTVPSEAEILRQCLQYLQLRHIAAWRSNTGAARLSGKGGRVRLVRFGVPGQPDVLGVLSPSGRMLAVEVKRPGKTPTAAQAAFLAAVRAAGGVAGCVHSVDELVELLRGAGRA